MNPLAPIAGMVEQVIRLINNIIEGKPMEQRRAEAVAAWYLGWPLLKLFLKKEQEDQIEAIMKTIVPPQ